MEAAARNAHELVADARLLLEAGRMPRAYALAELAAEELGKLIMLTERAGWILMQSVSPKAAAIWIADKIEALSDPEFVAIYVEYDAAFDCSPDDPRLYALADVPSGGWPTNPAGARRQSNRARTRPS
jgi:hypothetical protein